LIAQQLSDGRRDQPISVIATERFHKPLNQFLLITKPIDSALFSTTMPKVMLKAKPKAMTIVCSDDELLGNDEGIHWSQYFGCRLADGTAIH